MEIIDLNAEYGERADGERRMVMDSLGFQDSGEAVRSKSDRDEERGEGTEAPKTYQQHRPDSPVRVRSKYPCLSLQVILFLPPSRPTKASTLAVGCQIFCQFPQLVVGYSDIRGQ